ncbi:MAG: DUF6515 family protein [Ferruginibacter sp.]
MKKKWLYVPCLIATGLVLINTASAQRGERSSRNNAQFENRKPELTNRNFDRNQRPSTVERRQVNRDAFRQNINRNTERPRINNNNNNLRSPSNNNIANRPAYNPSSRPTVVNRPVRPVVVGSLNRPAYRPVYGYNRHPVYNAYNPNWQYGYLPRRNSYFYSLPSSYISINFGGFGYRYWDGIFYRPYNNLFTVVAPPIGIYINTLPLGYRRIMVRDYPYYYYNGTYYDQRGDNYYVVSPPVGAVVESLPDGYEKVTIDGETFYTIDGAQYKPVIQENGEIWYEVIKAN